MTDATRTQTHSSSGLFTAPALPGRHVRSRAVRDSGNVRGNIFLEEAALFASLTRTSRPDALVCDVCEKINGDGDEKVRCRFLGKGGGGKGERGGSGESSVTRHYPAAAATAAGY